ncbi:MAG: class I SAM-dependent methyltransferase [Candidatus Micrarchaeota archaeon]|nr:class I SAM-dependent methyltransferase [Candidatus Micrarchaeota archaeon]
MEDGERNFFTDVANNYDKLSKSLTAGLDNIWRRQAVELANGMERAKVLDVATGTGNIAVMMAKRNRNYSVVGIDTNDDMLTIARAKSRGLKNVKYLHGDVESLKLKANSFDVVVSAFSLGVFEDLPRAIGEMHRVLKPGGKLILLDINKGRNKLFMSLLGAYQMFSLTPTFTGDIRREVEAYIHNKRIKIDERMLKEVLEERGFREVSSKELSFKAVFIVTCVK